MEEVSKCCSEVKVQLNVEHARCEIVVVTTSCVRIVQGCATAVVEGHLQLGMYIAQW